MFVYSAILTGSLPDSSYVYPSVETARLFSRVAVAFCIPICNIRDFQFLVVIIAILLGVK